MRRQGVQRPQFKGSPPSPVASFSPASIAGLQLWLDASDASTITLDGSDKVEEWRDKSGNANHAGQASVTLRPSLSTVNGRVAVSFDDVDDLLAGTTLFAGDTAFTLFVVARMDAVATGQTAFFIMGTDEQFGLSFSAAASPLDRPGYLNGSIAWRPEASGSLTPGTVCVQKLSRTGASTAYSRYPGPVNVGNTDATTSTPPYGVYRLGWQGGAGVGRQQTTICEAILYSADIPAGDVTSVISYLGSRWGVTV